MEVHDQRLVRAVGGVFEPTVSISQAQRRCLKPVLGKPIVDAPALCNIAQRAANGASALDGIAEGGKLHGNIKSGVAEQLLESLSGRHPTRSIISDADRARWQKDPRAAIAGIPLRLGVAVKVHRIVIDRRVARTTENRCFRGAAHGPILEQ